MSFRIRTDESVSRSLRRLTRKQLGTAARQIADRGRPLGDRVHQVRTSLKRVRALTALAAASAEEGRARKAGYRLRALATSTAELRDAGVLLQTFDALLPNLASEPESGTLRAARARLVTRLRRILRAFENRQGPERLAKKLRRARRRAKKWLPREGGWRLPRQGLVASYRRARRAMKRAYDRKSGAAFHRWRIAVKRHRYQFQLLEDVWPGEATAHVEALERLGELLGKEHDLTVLEHFIEREHRTIPAERDRARLLELVDRSRYTLRAEAQPLGGRLFAERPTAFNRRLRDELHEGARRLRHGLPTIGAGGGVADTGARAWQPPGLQVI